MVIVNKILNVLIFLLAIAACIASVLLYQRRLELRQRADHLAKVLDSVAKSVEGEGESETGLKPTETVNSKNMDWKAYHLKRVKNADGTFSYEDWESEINVIEKHSLDLVNHKAQLVEKFIKLAGETELKYDKVDVLADVEGDEAAKVAAMKKVLNHFQNYDTTADQVIKLAGEIRARDNELAAGLVKASESINKGQELAEFKTVNLAALKGAIETLASNGSALLSRTNILAAGYGQILQELNGAENITVDTGADGFKSEDKDTIVSAISSFANDLKEVKGKLGELTVATNELEKVRIKVQRQTETIEELNVENADIKNENGKLKASATRLNRRIAELEAQLIKDGEGSVMKDMIAKVVEVNDRFDYVILNKGAKDQARVGGSMIIHNGGKYVCKIRITKVTDHTAVADILPVTRTVDAAGNYITPAVGSEAVTSN